MLTLEPLPVFPLYSSFHANVPDPRPGTSEKFTVKVCAPFAATRPTTTPSLSWPAQYGYSVPDDGPATPLGVKYVAAFPRES
jgi:hypothetical protein